jgi:SAM-dependent methyltransferase
MAEQHCYVGKDLEAMLFAVNYHRWILSLFEPYLGRRLVEVGAGTGSFSQLLLERQIESLSLVEPSTDMYQQLCRRMDQLRPAINLKTYNQIFEQVAPQIRTAEKPDSIIYVNVLEHIADDVAELRYINDALEPRGRLFIFVPALQWLHGSFDRQINHYRRYSKTELQQKCLAAGFKVNTSRYFDFFGVLPWWVKYRLLQSNRLDPGAVRFYDQRVVPVARSLESRFKPPLGKNVLLIAEKI